MVLPPRAKVVKSHAIDIVPTPARRRVAKATLKGGVLKPIASKSGSAVSGKASRETTSNALAVRLRITGKSSPTSLNVRVAGSTLRSVNLNKTVQISKLANARTPATGKTPGPPPSVYILCERRWLGLGEKAQRSSLGRRTTMGGSVIEGWGIRVCGAYRDKAKAEKALEVAVKAQSAAERDGGLRERSQLSIQTHDVCGQESSSKTEIGRQSKTKGEITRCVYTVSSSVGESFSSDDLPAGLAEFDGNYFFMSQDAEEEARKSEEQRGTPWGYPFNARRRCARPGEILKVFCSPVSENGANAYATGMGLQDVKVPGLTSLDNHDLARGVSYAEGGLAQVRLQQADRKSTVRVLLTVREHPILDYKPARALQKAKSGE